MGSVAGVDGVCGVSASAASATSSTEFVGGGGGALSGSAIASASEIYGCKQKFQHQDCYATHEAVRDEVVARI